MSTDVRPTDVYLHTGDKRERLCISLVVKTRRRRTVPNPCSMFGGGGGAALPLTPRLSSTVDGFHLLPDSHGWRKIKSPWLVVPRGSGSD